MKLKGTLVSYSNGKILVIYSAPTHVGLMADAEARIVLSGIKPPTNLVAINAIKGYIESNWRGRVVTVDLVDSSDDLNTGVIKDYREVSLNEELLLFAERNPEQVIS